MDNLSWQRRTILHTGPLTKCNCDDDHFDAAEIQKAADMTDRSVLFFEGGSNFAPCTDRNRTSEQFVL